MTTFPSALQTLLAAETSAAVPRLSTAQLLDASQNRALRELWTEPAANPMAYAGKRIAVIATDGVEEIELTTALHFFKSRGAITHLIAPKKPVYPPHLDVQIPAMRDTHILTIHYIETAHRNSGWVRLRQKAG